MCKRTLIKNWGGGGSPNSKAEIRLHWKDATSNIRKHPDFDCLKEVDEKRHFLAAHSGGGVYKLQQFYFT